MRALGNDDPRYYRTVQAILEDKSIGDLPSDHPGRLYSNIWHEISVKQGLLARGDRLIVPHAGRKWILELLHKAHAGITKTQQQARQLYYWNGMNNSIKQMVESCDKCQEHRPRQQRETNQCTRANFPMEMVCSDLFQCMSKYFLVVADRFSGFFFVSHLKKTDTRSVTQQMWAWFMDWGIPKVRISDGGPQYRAEFDAFCKDKGIEHAKSSPYNPASNGFAENAVKHAKQLMIKCEGFNDLFRQSVLEWRNTPRADGYSPAQLFLGHRQRTSLPALEGAYIDRQRVHHQRLGHEVEAAHSFNSSAKDLTPLCRGDHVRIQNPKSGLWDSEGIVREMRDTGRTYVIQVDGVNVLRNRKFLKVKIPPTLQGSFFDTPP